jgi:dihydropteroate synthase
MRFAPFQFRHVSLDWSRPYLVGIVNVTPDSFSDGGAWSTPAAAVAHGELLAEAGADVLDIGGESTRPGAARVSESEELDRVLPVIEGLAGRVPLPLSVDTTRAAVARAALAAGAEVVNDISGGLFDPAIAEVAAGAGAAYVCGHVRGASVAAVHAAEASPPSYEEVAFELGARVMALPAALRHRTIVDPCLGFGKGTAQNLELTRQAGALGAALGCPVMIGPSRKRFLGELCGGAAVGERDPATVGAALAAVAAGAQLVRVHDVKLLRPALIVYDAVMGGAS